MRESPSYPLLGDGASSSSSTSTEPLQSSGAWAFWMSPLARWVSQSSISISSTVPSKACSSMVPSSSSMATTSKLSPSRSRYQAPISGFALIVIAPVFSRGGIHYAASSARAA